MVIGVDLRNEIRGDLMHLNRANWGKGGKNDWHLAATNAGNLILKSDPDQLILVEGLNFALDMDPIRSKPVILEIPNKLVYSFHLYSFSCFDYKGYDDFKDKMTQKYGYILEEGHDYTAPLWLGEFGENTQNEWWQFTIQYLEETDISWAYWAYTGYKNEPTGEDNDETYGIVDLTFK